MLAKLVLSSLILGNMVSAAYACADYGYLKNEEMNFNSSDFNEHEVLLFAIDKKLRNDNLASSILDCLSQQNMKIFDFFRGKKYRRDLGIYQFAFANFSYGSVFVDLDNIKTYLNEKYSNSMNLLKVTYDFDVRGYAYINNVFGISYNEGDSVFYEYKNGKFEITNRCLECHTKERPFFFRSNFTGAIE